MLNRAELLQSFCGDDRSREMILTPSVCEGYVFATGGNALVRLPRLPEDVYKEWDGVARVMPRDASGLELMDVGEFPEAEMTPCEDCNGAGHYNECKGCDGEGYTDCPHCGQEDECVKCKGNGIVAGDDETCDTCKGTGSREKPHNVMFGVRSFAVPLLRKLKVFPNLKIQTGGQLYQAAYFTFDGGDGVIMPCRQ